MNKLRMSLPLVIVSGWLVAAGCDDDRGVVDLGAGGTDGQQQGGAGAGGDVANPGGAGGSVAGGSGGAGGAGGAEECPTDVFEADGQPCSTEGQECVVGSEDPCEFGQFLTCLNGVWFHQEAFPGECGGAGGAGGGAGAGGVAGGAGGAGGAR
ncbi:MAG TPA: hypothetical protein VHP33_07165 [Polyangiaceae bacterium]|nr:hypothetical protein [Polyangiaceae bacterium]